MVVVRRLLTDAVPGSQLAEIRALLDAAFPGDPDGEFTDDDWHHTIGGLHVIVVEHAVVVAHASVVPRTITVGDVAFRTGYVEGVATRPDRQGEGLGSRAMMAANDHIRATGKLGVLGTGAHHFYERLGWERWRGPSFVRRAAGALDRTAEDDDGLMVLRTGRSATVDLAASISCEDRPGDCW